MQKVLLADDEAVIVRGLKKLIDWEKLGFSVVGTAGDGEEAKTKILSLRPDIVVMDIRMPKMDGLEVLREFEQQEKKPQFIFISGYQEFFYAHEAIRHGAVDYLLKPVAAKDLIGSLKKAAERLNEKDTAGLFQKEENLFQKLFRKINNGQEYAMEELYDYFRSSGIEMEHKFYAGVCFGMERAGGSEQNTFEQMELKKFVVFNRIGELFTESGCGFAVRKEENCIYLMGVFPEKEEQSFVEKYILRMKGHLEEEYDMAFTVGIGNIVYDPKDLFNSYKTSRFCHELYYFEEKNIIDIRDVHRDYRVSFEDFNQLKEKVLHSIIVHDGKVIKGISDTMDAMEAIHYGNRYAVENRCLLFTGELIEKLLAFHMIDGEIHQIQDEMQSIIRNQGTFRELKNAILRYYEKLLPQVYEHSTQSGSKEILLAKQYIEENYMKELSLKELAEVACMSQNYFSTVFKKETGVNYKSYLTEIRMEQALKLVCTTDLKTYEIAERVGYSDTRRFAEAFKQKYDMSPADYRKE